MPTSGKDLAEAGVVQATIEHSPGRRVRLLFTFEKVAHTFASEWPTGQSEPEVLGVFDGTDDPRLPKVATSTRQARWKLLEALKLNASQFDDRGCGELLREGEGLGAAVARERGSIRRSRGHYEELGCSPRPWASSEECTAKLGVKGDPETQRSLEVTFTVKDGKIQAEPAVICFLMG